MAHLCIKTPSSAILVLIFQLLVLRPRPIDQQLDQSQVFSSFLKIINSQMIPVWHQSGDSGGFPRSPSRSLWRWRRTRRGSCTGQTRGGGWLGWWKYLPVWSTWFIFIPLIESGGKVKATQKVVNPTLLVEIGSDLPLSREKLTLAVPGWIFTFKEKQM